MIPLLWSVWTNSFAADGVASPEDVDPAPSGPGEDGGDEGGGEEMPDIDASALVPADDPYRMALEAWLAKEQGITAEEIPRLASNLVLFERSLGWQTGKVTLRDGAIALDLGEGDQYAPPEDASRILELWGNPPDPNTDGMLLPAGAHLFGTDSWAVLLRFEEDGWVDDSDASSIDYDELLSDMKASNEESSAERRNLGLGGVTLTGWAEPPRYDAGTNVLYWATLLRSDDGGVTLNYDVRVLGRRGVLSLNALADEGALERVKRDMERVRLLGGFQDGHRYADYVPGTDTKAAYGLAALIGGGVIAAKAGGFKWLIAALLASKKLVVAGAVAAAAAARGVFSRIFGGAPAEKADR